MDKYRPIKELTLALFVIVVIIILLPKPKRYEDHDTRPWRPKDIYLIYKMWTDKDLIELKEKIEKDEMVRNKKMG